MQRAEVISCVSELAAEALVDSALFVVLGRVHVIQRIQLEL